MIKLTAHIPTQTYGFLEVSGDLADQSEVERLYNHYAETPVNFSSAPQSDRKEIKAFVGGSIFYSSATHTYTNKEGEVYLSGSVYANQFRTPFDKLAIAKKMATKYGVQAQDIIDMWELKGDVSRGFGTAMHAALELYGKYNGLATSLERDTHLHDHPVIKKAVMDFYAGREQEKAEYEVMIVDHKAKRAGQIDRLLILDPIKKICQVEDYKTNADIKKDLEVYWKQLDFYVGILEADGWTCHPSVIHHWDGEWHTYTKGEK